jgi:hypothetical protein
MLPFEIPAGTTPAALVTDLVPKAHARLVPSSVPQDSIRCGVYFLGSDLAYTVDIKGAALKVTEEAPRDAALYIAVALDTVQAFLDDAAGPKKYVPRFEPAEIKMMTDPRLLKRVLMAQGKVELGLTDFPGGAARLFVCTGKEAKHGPVTRSEDDDADVTITTGTNTFERIQAGALGPEAALADGDVSVKGKRFVAGQFALAVAPFYPKPR